ncbi:hypothetical protein [Microbacterium paludicola]|uniref:hypothetical protein n=1 Tax=Microbacterium paludicola TaxID=300019 RepID=UPI0031CEF422
MLAALTLLGVLWAGAPAAASPSSEVVEGRFLRIVSTADPDAMRGMLPGDVAVWDVTISAQAPEPGQIDIALSGDGHLPLSVDVLACEGIWETTGCSSGERPIEQALPAPIAGPPVPILEVPADAVTHLRLMVSVPRDADVTEQATTVLQVRAHGYGDELAASPPGDSRGELPRTGMQLGGVALLAIGAVIVGIAGARLLAARRRAEAAP